MSTYLGSLLFAHAVRCLCCDHLLLVDDNRSRGTGDRSDERLCLVVLRHAELGGPYVLLPTFRLQARGRPWPVAFVSLADLRDTLPYAVAFAALQERVLGSGKPANVLR